MDLCVDVFKEAGWEEVLPQFFDYYLNAPHEDRCYLFKGPDWMTWARHIDPEKDIMEFGDFPPGKDPEDAWLIYYLQNSRLNAFKTMFSLFPYPLPYIAFGRAAKGRFNLTFLPFEAIRKKCV